MGHRDLSLIEGTGSLDPASFTYVDYSSADEGDVDLPVLSKAKSKRTQVVHSPKHIPPSTSQLHHSSQAGDEHAFAPGIENSAKGSTPFNQAVHELSFLISFTPPANRFIKLQYQTMFRHCIREHDEDSGRYSST